MSISEIIRNGDVKALTGELEANPAAVNTPDERGFTPLVLATYLNQKEIANTLLDMGADIDVQDAIMGNTALMGVCFKGSFELAKLLIDKGADKNLKNANGQTALDFAKEGGYSDIQELLKS